MKFRDVPMPERIARLEKDRRGFPIPWNVLRAPDGTAIFTVNDEQKRIRALSENLCPICGETNDELFYFVGGPKSAFHPQGWFIDLPGHIECVEYALRVCPYLAARNYTPYELGELASKAQSMVPETIVCVDYTQDPKRPPVFCLLAARQLFLNGPFVKPVPPLADIRFWTLGERVSDEEGMRLAQEAFNS